MKKLFLLPFFITAACSSKPPAPEKAIKAPTTVAEAVASPLRAPNAVARDIYRHPLETLTFFGVKPDMTVIEISPASGWYTQILAPLLNEKGQYIAAQQPDTNEHLKQMNDTRREWLKSNEVYTSKAKTVDFDPESHSLAPDGSADMVLTFRNVHNWMSQGAAPAAFTAFYKALKHGGVLGVVEHRANPRKHCDPKAKSGYVCEKDILAMAKKAGFKLVAKSEINANAKDTKDYPVWTLPPVLKNKDKDREKYLAIGESDRMTLKFVKP